MRGGRSRTRGLSRGGAAVYPSCLCAFVCEEDMRKLQVRTLGRVDEDADGRILRGGTSAAATHVPEPQSSPSQVPQSQAGLGEDDMPQPSRHLRGNAVSKLEKRRAPRLPTFVALELVDNFARLKVPDDDLVIFRTSDEEAAGRCQSRGNAVSARARLAKPRLPPAHSQRTFD